MQSKWFINVSIGLAIALFTLLAMPSTTHAQLTRGAISGTVRDQNGAVVPGAQVKVTNPQTNVTRETTTNDEGFYRVGAVEPGTYTVLVEKDGFSKIENRAVVGMRFFEGITDEPWRSRSGIRILSIFGAIALDS